MIIEKTAITYDEKQELNAILEKYLSLGGESDDISLFLQQLMERHEELKRKRYRTYILSFSGRKEDVLIDVKEILNAVEKRDFENEQDKRRSILAENENGDVSAEIECMLKKNFHNFLSFLFRITSAQATVIEYNPDELTVTAFGEQNTTKRAMSESDRKLFDLYVNMLIEKATEFYRKPQNFSVSGLYNSLTIKPIGNMILQNKAINAFSHISNRSFAGTDAFSEKAVAFQENVEITIDDIGNSKFTVSTQKVKDLMLEHLAEQLPRGITAHADSVAISREVTLTVKEVAQRFQTGTKEARQMLNDAVKALYHASVKWKELSYYTKDGKRRKEPELMEYEHRYLSGMGKTPDTTPVIKGKAKVTFDYDFALLLSRSGYVMFYHPNLYHINANVNRHSYYLGRKMCEYYNSIVRDYQAETLHQGSRIFTKNANRLSVKNLIKVCPDLPSYDEIMNSDRAVKRRIIEPFERDMYALCEKYHILTTWRYCNAKGQPLSDEQWQNLNYHDWVKLYIEFEVADYPDQTKRLKNKAVRIEKTVQANTKK